MAVPHGGRVSCSRDACRRGSVRWSSGRSGSSGTAYGLGKTAFLRAAPEPHLTRVKGVQVDELDAIWVLVEGLIAATLARCPVYWPLLEVKNSIRIKKRQLWVTWPGCEAIGITSLDNLEDGHRWLRIFCFAGKMPVDWRDILLSVECWAQHEKDCWGSRLEGRRGWARRLKPMGYVAVGDEYMKVFR